MALTEMRTLMLWALLAKPGGTGLQKDIRPEMKKADRDALVSEGLIASVARPADNARGHRQGLGVGRGPSRR